MTIEERVVRLERSARRWRWATLAALGVAAAAGWRGDDVVTASKFVLVDGAGTPRGEWTVAGGSAVLAMFGGRLGEQPPLYARVAADGDPSITLRAVDEAGSIEAGVSGGAGPLFKVAGPDGGLVAAAGAVSRPTTLVVRGPRGETLLKVPDPTAPARR